MTRDDDVPGFIEILRESQRQQWQPGMIDLVCALALRGLRARWRPIATAPKTGETILALTTSRVVQVIWHWYVENENGVWMTPEGRCWRVVYPTHWMPMPEQQEADRG